MGVVFYSLADKFSLILRRVERHTGIVTTLTKLYAVRTMMIIQRTNRTFWAALLISFSQLLLGYVTFGWLTAIIFSLGFLGSFILWCLNQSQPMWENIKVPYVLTFILFIAHRAEEKWMGFFAELAKVSGAPTPELTSLTLWILISSTVGAWLLVPFLVKRQIALGYFFAWSFFASMGITELAHFMFPLLQDAPYGYFPGMGSVFLLAPFAWWGMGRLKAGAALRIKAD